MMSLVDSLFDHLFCQDTFNCVKGTSDKKPIKVDALEVPSSRMGKNNGAVNSKRGRQSQKNLNLNLPKFDDDGNFSQDLYETCFESSLRLLSNLCGAGYNPSQSEFNYHIAKQIVSALIKHLRQHLYNHQKKQSICCFHSVYVMLTLLQQPNNEQLYEVAKERDLINFLFNFMPHLFQDEAKSILVKLNASSNTAQNFNSLIIGQGFQGQQSSFNVSQQLGQGSSKMLNLINQQQQQLQAPISAKINIPSSRSPINQQKGNNKREERKVKDKAFIHKLSFNRAISEPPSAHKNAVLPVTEDYDDEQSSEEFTRNTKQTGVLEQVLEEEPKRYSKGQQNKISNGNSGEKQVPPLMISQIHQFQQLQSQTPQNLLTAHLQQQNTNNSSSLVMTSYLNMPLGLFNNTMNHLSSNSRQGGGTGTHFNAPPVQTNFKLNFVPQTTIAKSRLTRRQMSMSRKYTQKFQSVSSFAQGVYGEDLGSREQASRRHFINDYNSQERQSHNASAAGIGDKTSSSILKKGGIAIPKLNINQIQRVDPTGQPLNTTSHLQNAIKSSHRSNAYSNQNFENQLMAVQQQHQSSNPYQTTTGSQFLRSHLNQIQQMQANGGIMANTPVAVLNLNNETERNISLYDDMNGSFIDDIGLVDGGQTLIEGAGFMFENAGEKLRLLAIQLGEACLTNDLAALISQKRDIELVKSARKSVNSGFGRISKFKDKNSLLKLQQRSVSVSYNYEPFFMRGESKNEIKRLDSDNESNSEENQAKLNQTLPQKTRLLFLNLVYVLLKRYDINETRFLKHPISSLNAFIESKQFKQQRRQKEIQAYESGKVAKISSQYDDDEIKTKVFIMTDGSMIFIDDQNNKIDNHVQLRAHIHSQEIVVFKIYQKFTFVNEEIIRNQVKNELENFASKEKGDLANILPRSSHGNRDTSQMMNQVPNLNLNGLDSNQKWSVSNSLSDLMDQSSASSDALSTIKNPNIMWTSNGIGFDFSSTSTSAKSSAHMTFQKERIRKKLDVMLYNLDRRIKQLIQQQFHQQNSLEKINQSFAKNLRDELQTLNAYIESQKSRIMLYQIIEVILESLLMVKKMLTDLALKTSIFIVDFSKHNQSNSPDFLQQNGAGTQFLANRSLSFNHQASQQIKSPISMSRTINHHQSKGHLIKTQNIYRQLFAEYLRLVSNLLSMVPIEQSANMTTFETIKLLNEIYIAGDEQWQESIKTYVISLFLSDISSSIRIDKVNDIIKDQRQASNYQAQLLIEELRGTNLVNFDEQSFQSIVLQSAQALFQVDSQPLMNLTKKTIFHYLSCAKNVMRYFEGVLLFFQKIIGRHFSHRYGNQKNKQSNSNGGDRENKDLSKQAEVKQSDLRRASGLENQASQITQDEFNQQQQKYWKQTIRRILYQVMYLITPPNGLLSSYLQTNAINFMNVGPGQNTYRFNSTGRGASLSPQRPTPTNNFSYNLDHTNDPFNFLRNGECPLNYTLTTSILSFIHLVFDLPERFTKYAFIQEELMLFYIRTHYISFVRLYNKNFSKKEQSTSQRANQSKKRSMTLCKKHLECLFSIAKNRSEDTRRKLYQFKILQFLCQEIELEFECTTTANKQKRNRLLEEAASKTTESQLQEAETKSQTISVMNVEQQQPIQPKSLPQGLSKLNLSGLGPPSILFDPEVPQDKMNESQVQKKVVGIPKLKIGGLGLSEIIPENGGGKTQIEIDQLRQLAEDQKKKMEANQTSGRSKRALESKRSDLDRSRPLVPQSMINTEKLGLNASVDLSSAKKFNKVHQEPIQQQLQKLPFSIPKINVAGLGFSDLRPDSGKKPIVDQEIELQKQEQNDQVQIVKKSLPFGVPKLNITGLTLSELVQDQPQTLKPSVVEQKVEEQVKKPSIPKLNVAGLGLSDLTPDTENKQSILQNDVKEFTPQQNPVQVRKGLPFTIPKLNVDGLGLSDLVKDEQKPTSQPITEDIKEVKTSTMSLGIPKLNVANLGLSTLVPDDKPSQILVEEPKISEATQIQKKTPSFQIPKLNVAGLGLSDLVQDPKDNLQIEQSQQPPAPSPIQEQKKPSFSIPKLNVAGLGLSDLVQDPPAKEISVEQKPVVQEEQFKQPVKKPIIGIPKLNITGLGLSELVQDKPQELPQPPVEQAPPQPKKSLGFSIPKLNVAGLGLSDLVQDNIPSEKPQANNIAIEPDLSTINPTLNNEGHSIEFDGGFKNKLGNHSTTNQDEKLFHKSQRAQAVFENTVPIKAIIKEEEKKQSNEISQNDSLKKQQQKQFSANQSIESAQLIDYVTQFKELKEEQKNDTMFKMRASQQSQATQLRVESIMDAPSALGMSLIPSPMPDQMRTNGNNEAEKQFFSQTPMIVNSNGSRTSLTIIDQKPALKINFSKINTQNAQIVNSGEDSSNNIVRQQQQPILKKPLIPALKIPEKQEQPEGKDKIQQQIAYSQQLNEKEEGGNLTKLQKELNRNNVKFQVLIENQKSNKSILNMTKEEDSYLLNDKQPEQLNEDEAFYLRERSMRPIYQDEELHVLMLSLTICLLLTPERGTLDDLYCSQYPLDNGKQNVLFLLHHHLNHPRNNQQNLVNQVLEKVQQDVNPPLAGLRLLKLLCTSLFDMSLYNNGKEWQKIAEGAYAKVFDSKTNLLEPSQVAIKQLLLPKSIYDRCVLHDIFTEITCLEELRLEPCVSDLYDYGVDNNSYYIVMKRYSCSLRQWRQKQQKSLNENLSMYLSIYKEFLKGLMTIHSHNVTHYDIKCDNVFLDINPVSSSSLSQQFSNFIQSDNEDENGGKMRLTIGDFGECKIFSNEKDELCQRNRGTDYCKSPEMLQLTINTRKDTDKYDRRKQVGTNRLSDVWSAGCLLYELLTGEFLFYTSDYLQFHFRVTRPSESLFTPDKEEKINNNVYIIDFLKYILVRDVRVRPSIENVIKRFEHVHALLVSTTGGYKSLTNYRMSLGQYSENSVQSQKIHSKLTLAKGQNFQSIIEQSVQMMIKQNKDTVQTLNQDEQYYIRILEDIALCNLTWYKNHQSIGQTYTHLICSNTVLKAQKYHYLRDNFDVLELPDTITFSDGISYSSTPLLLLPQVLDFLRRVALTRGWVLFLEHTYSLKDLLLLSLSYIFKTTAYETFTLLHSQTSLLTPSLSPLSSFLSLVSQANSYLSTYPRFQCRCGQCLLILKRKFASNLDTLSCACQPNQTNSNCPSPGCSDLIAFYKTAFRVVISSTNESVQWGFLDKDSFILGPSHNSSLQRVIMSGVSNGIERNSKIVAVKYMQGGRKQEGERWTLYKCKDCQVWTHAVNEREERIAVVMNNRVREQKSVNIRVMNAIAMQGRGAANGQNVRVPILSKIRMSLPF